MILLNYNRRLSKTTNFIANFVIENNVPMYNLYDEGRIVYDKGLTISSVEVNMKDHLGNVRAVFDITTGQVKQTNTYYPFGMQNSSLSANTTTTKNFNEYKYNGKMFQDENGLNWYDYGARFYDAVTSRFITLDPKSEVYPVQSPYCYAANDPIKFIDYNGNNPIILGVAAIAASDAILIATGVLTSGIILKLTIDGKLEINPTYIPEGYSWQQKREKDSNEENSKIAKNHSKSVDENIGEPDPSGENNPKRDLGITKKIVVGSLLVIATWMEYTEMYNRNLYTGENKKKKNGSSKDGESEKNNTMPIPNPNKVKPTPKPSKIWPPKEEDKHPLAPRYDDNNQ